MSSAGWRGLGGRGRRGPWALGGWSERLGGWSAGLSRAWGCGAAGTGVYRHPTAGTRAGGGWGAGLGAWGGGGQGLGTRGSWDETAGAGGWGHGGRDRRAWGAERLAARDAGRRGLGAAERGQLELPTEGAEGWGGGAAGAEGSGPGPGLRWSLAAPTLSLPFFASPTFAPSFRARSGSGSDRSGPGWGSPPGVQPLTWLRRSPARLRLCVAEQVPGWSRPRVPGTPSPISGPRTPEGSFPPSLWGRGRGRSSAATPQPPRDVEPAGIRWLRGGVGEGAGSPGPGAGTGQESPLSRPAGGAMATPGTLRDATPEPVFEFPQKTVSMQVEVAKRLVCITRLNLAFPHLVITTTHTAMTALWNALPVSVPSISFLHFNLFFAETESQLCCPGLTQTLGLKEILPPWPLPISISFDP